MPVYNYRCPQGHRTTRFFHVSSRKERVLCESDGCRKMAARDITADIEGQSPHSFEPYFDEHLTTKDNPDGTYVKTYEEKRKAKRRAGVRERGSYVE